MINVYKRLVIFTGPMFSGKTTSLLNSYNFSKVSNNEKIAFKFSKDKRYTDNKNNVNQNKNLDNKNLDNKNLGNKNLDNKNININSNNDLKGNILTHTKNNIPAYYIDKCKDINEYITDDIKEIYIDEGQFFTDIYKWYTILCNSINSIESIYISGLNYDYKGNIFNEEFNKLIEIKHPYIEIHKLQSKCYKCNCNADFSILLNKEQRTLMDNNILIGDDSIYQPACKEHINF